MWFLIYLMEFIWFWKICSTYWSTTRMCVCVCVCFFFGFSSNLHNCVFLLTMKSFLQVLVDGVNSFFKYKQIRHICEQIHIYVTKYTFSCPRNPRNSRNWDLETVQNHENRSWESKVFLLLLPRAPRSSQSPPRFQTGGTRLAKCQA